MFGSSLWRNESRKSNGRPGEGNGHHVRLQQVVKTYESAAGIFTALKGVDLQVKAGEFVSIIGKSGSGKSTLINMITGMDRPTAGQVLVGDTAVHTLTEEQIAVWRGRTIGVVFQFFQLLPTLTAVENVMLPMDYGRRFVPAERPDRAMQLLEQMGMADHAHELPRRFRADSSRASPSRARWRTIRPSWPPTSQPATWTLSPPNRSFGSLKSGQIAARRF